MKKLCTIIYMLLLTTICFLALAAEDFHIRSYAAEPSEINAKFDLDDHRVYKASLAGKYESVYGPEYYFEILDDSAVVSDALADMMDITGDFQHMILEVYCHEGTTWLYFFAWREHGEPSHRLYFYSAEAVEPKAFILEEAYVAPRNRVVYARSAAGNETPLEKQLQLDPEFPDFAAAYFNPAYDKDAFDMVLMHVEEQGLGRTAFGLFAENIFPNMGERINILELEKIVGSENLSIGRGAQNDIPEVSFQYQGYNFVYYLFVDEPYDILPTTMLTTVSEKGMSEKWRPTEAIELKP